MADSKKIIYTRASTDEELSQILTIQQRNIKQKLSNSEIEHDGFVTVTHDLQLLKKMNTGCAHIVAKDGIRVAGYALAMMPSFRNDITMLSSLFEMADQLLSKRSYLVMGQVCIDKPYRRQGIFRNMYAFYRQQLQEQFDCLLTEVAVNNPRSLMAHKSVGFHTLVTRYEHGAQWELMIWDWRK